MSKIIYITDGDFEEKVIKNDKPVLVDFCAEWCSPCKAIAPQLEELSNNRDDIVVAKIDVDSNRDYAGKLGIRSIPTLVYFQNGEETDRVIGADIAKVKQMIA